MKKVIGIILFIISFSLNAQTKLDSMLFDKVNDYRESQGISRLMWDNDVYKAANHHSTYLKLINKDSLKTVMTHAESKNVEGFEELMYFTDRISKYVKRDCILSSENITGTLKGPRFPEEKLVDIIFENWKKSKKHCKIMLSTEVKSGACSIVVFVGDFYLTVENKKSVKMQKSFATINFAD